MTRTDIILVALILSFSIAILKTNQTDVGNFAEVKINGLTINQLDLSKDTTFNIQNEYGSNRVKVKGGAVSVISADCPDKVCVKTGAIKLTGEIIACVPHKLLIKIVEK